MNANTWAAELKRIDEPICRVPVAAAAYRDKRVISRVAVPTYARPQEPGRSRYSGSLYTWVKEHGGKVLPATATPAPGDLVFYGNGPSESVHVGIVQRVYPDGRITQIDGNNDHNEVGIAGPLQPSQATVQHKHIYGYAQPPAVNSPKA